MDIKKIILPILLVGVFAAYIVYNRFYQNPSTQNPVVDNSNQNTQNQQPQDNPSTENGYKDGQYTGNAVDAFFGPMQVKAVIANGRISDIVFLQSPNKAGYTAELNAKTLPILKSAAIASQKANVNIISGATQTAQGFIISLDSALKQAGSKEQVDVKVTAPTPK